MTMKKLCLLSLLFLTGCGYTNWSTSVTSWATAATPELTTVSNSYSSSNNIHMLAQQSDLVNQYATSGFQPGQIQDFISGNDLQIRLNALAALNNYTNALNKLASGKDLAVLAVTPPKTPAVNLAETEMNAAIATMDSIATMVLKAKTKSKLSKIIKTADPEIQKFAVLFAADLSDLKAQADRDYTTMMINQDQFIQSNQTTLSVADMKTQVTALAQIESNMKKSDSDFNTAILNIQSFAAMHHKLAGEK